MNWDIIELIYAKENGPCRWRYGLTRNCSILVDSFLSRNDHFWFESLRLAILERIQYLPAKPLKSDRFKGSL